jgi:Asp-tRNA(Asn)/Glu-tRNA(Gln) amidotransferase A subunit family amidase
MDRPHGESNELAYLTIREARHLLDSGQVSSEELTRAALDQIATLDGQVSAYNHVSAEVAIGAARDFDRRHADGGEPLSRLDGVPMGLKDVLITRGLPTTCGLSPPEELRTSLRWHRAGQAESRRGGAAGQDQL